MERGLLEQALLHAGATVLGEQERAVCDLALTKADLMQMGISGTPDSLGRRKALLRSLGLPEHMSANALLQYLNSCCTRQELDEALKKTEI
jgi:ribonuclease M5